MLRKVGKRELEIRERLQKIYEDLSGRTDIKIEPKTKIDESIGLTSLGKIQYVVLIEEDFGLEIPNTVLHSVKTADDMIKYILKATK